MTDSQINPIKIRGFLLLIGLLLFVGCKKTPSQTWIEQNTTTTLETSKGTQWLCEEGRECIDICNSTYL